MLHFRRLRAFAIDSSRILTLLIATASISIAQDSVISRPKREHFQLSLPTKGKVVIPESEENLIVSPDDSAPVVGRLYLTVGDHAVVLMPNGQLISLKKSQTLPTDRPFTPLSKDEIAERLIKNEFPGFKSRKTKRYIYVYNSSDQFARGTSAILESMYPGLFRYCKGFNSNVHHPATPMIVVMFKTQGEFRQYRDVPDGLVAYYNTISNYIVMYEQSDLTEIAPQLAIKQAISTIAHEGVHQILHNIGMQKRLSRWPIWFTEGMADYFAPTELKRLRWKGVGLPNDLRMHELAQHLKQFPNSSTQGQLFRATIGAKQIDSLGYAASWATIHYLAERRRRDFSALIKDISSLEPLETSISREHFEKHFGTDYAALEASIVDHLKSLPYADPIANQIHYVLMSQDRKRRHVFLTTSPQEIHNRKTKLKNQRHWIQSFPNRSSAQIFAKKWINGR